MSNVGAVETEIFFKEYVGALAKGLDETE